MSYADDLVAERRRILAEMARLEGEKGERIHRLHEISQELSRQGYDTDGHIISLGEDGGKHSATLEQVLARAVSIPERYDNIQYASFYNPSGTQINPPGGVFRVLNESGEVQICKRWSELLGKPIYDPYYKEEDGGKNRWYTEGGVVRYYTLSEVKVIMKGDE